MSTEGPSAKPPDGPDVLVRRTRAFWRRMGRSLIDHSLKTADEAAKQIVAVAGILAGLYFNGIALADLRGKVTETWQMLIYLGPVALLLVSLVCALLVFFPSRYKLNLFSSEASEVVYRRVLSGKMRMLQLAGLFLALGVGAILVALGLYLGGG